MKHWMKKLVVMTAAGVLAVSSLTGCGSLNHDAEVAKVGDESISLGVANFFARMQQAQYETYYAGMMGMTGEEMWAQEISEGTTYESSVKDSVMESLEELYLLRQHMGDYDISLTEEENTKIAEAAAAFEAANKDGKKLVSGYEKYVKEYLELVTISNKMDAAMKEGVDENVTDEEAAQKAMSYVYFSFTKTSDDGSSEDMTDEEKEALKTTAEQFLTDLKADETKDIDAVAEASGQTVQTVTFDSESTSPASELIEAADALKNEGDITDLIETDYGYYVGKVTSMLDRDATDAKKESIVQQRKQDQYDEILDSWKEDTKIQVNENVWKKVKFENQGVTIKQVEEEESEEEQTDTEEQTTDDSGEDVVNEDDTSTEEE